MSRPRRLERIVENEVDGEFVLHDPETGRSYLLNQVSAAIWALCDGQSTVDDIARRVSNYFQGADEREVLEDTIELISQMQSEQILLLEA